MTEPRDPDCDRPPDAARDLDPDSTLGPGLDAAFGAREPSDMPSVLQRVQAISGACPRVSLPDAEVAGATPVLRPLVGSDNRAAGKYLIHGELGRGGVGAVFRGHDQDLGRDVAIKFLHERYQKEPALLHRFVEEAQIGGQLQHPGIVPVYDIGMRRGKDGAEQPFFAMKLIKGETLARRLGARRDPRENRSDLLRIFEDVCQTVAYAHARGVVHRDLKPANVMIGSFGEVQVVDWGMGKVLRHGGVADEERAARAHSALSVIETVRSKGHGSQSIVGSVMGTPAYMPPEQAHGDVEAMDERSDVFALGAILCEILTGQPPYVGAPDELLAQAAMARLDGARQRLAACGADEDLLDLTYQCLLPAPAARPRSASEVAERIRAHLATREERAQTAEVEAAEARVKARALKRTLTLGAILLVAILAGLGGSVALWQRAERNGQEARRELRRATELREFVTEMLMSVTPERAGGHDRTLMVAVLERAAEQVKHITDESVAADMHFLLAQVYASLDLPTQGLAHIHAASPVFERMYAELDPRRLYARAEHARLLHQVGRYAEALAICEELVPRYERVFGEEASDTVIILTHLGVTLRSTGNTERAEASLQRAVNIGRRNFGLDHGPTKVAAMNLLLMQVDADRYQAAIDNARQLLAEVDQFATRDHPFALQIRHLEVAALKADGRHEAARIGLEDLIARSERVLGPMNVNTIGRRGELADLLMRTGEIDAALELMERVAAQLEAIGDRSRIAASTQHNLAMLYELKERPADALTCRQKWLSTLRPNLPPVHADIADAVARIGDNLVQMGRPAEAEPFQREAVEIYEQLHGRDHVTTLGAINNLGMSRHACGELEQARTLLTEAFRGLLRVAGFEHAFTQNAFGNLVRLCNRMFEAGDAEPIAPDLLRDLVALAEHPTANPAAPNDLALLILRFDDREAHLDTAIRLARQAVACAEEHAPQHVAVTSQTLTRTLLAADQLPAAIEALRRGVEAAQEPTRSAFRQKLRELEATLAQRGESPGHSGGR
ncbi:MAG: serine/threonine protein kinase [Planctomycetes bacterium]|nr:serine/threonine protein kinase [Planctomycetota bacterium]